MTEWLRILETACHKCAEALLPFGAVALLCAVVGKFSEKHLIFYRKNDIIRYYKGCRER